MAGSLELAPRRDAVDLLCGRWTQHHRSEAADPIPDAEARQGPEGGRSGSIGLLEGRPEAGAGNRKLTRKHQLVLRLVFRVGLSETPEGERSPFTL